MDIILGLGLFWIPIIIVVLLFCIRQINQYERGIVFTMGKYSRMWDPGWHVLIPVFQKLVKVDVRVKTVDIPDQEAITKDNKLQKMIIKDLQKRPVGG